MNFFPASDLFEIKVQDNQAFPLNLEFEIRPQNSGNFKGPGIYFLYYKNEYLQVHLFQKLNFQLQINIHLLF